MNDLKIAVVDDDVFYLNIFKQNLLNLGFENVTIYESGIELLNNIESRPELVFLDYSMEDMSGEEVLNKIKRFDPNIFVVIVSAQEGIQPAIDTLKQGAFDYLQKGENELKRIKDVIQNINELKELMEKTKPSILKRIFKK